MGIATYVLIFALVDVVGVVCAKPLLVLIGVEKLLLMVVAKVALISFGTGLVVCYIPAHFTQVIVFSRVSSSIKIVMIVQTGFIAVFVFLCARTNFEP